MTARKAYKVVSSLPAQLESDTEYYVRVGDGFDHYVTDATGSIAYKVNGAGIRHYAASGSGSVAAPVEKTGEIISLTLKVTSFSGATLSFYTTDNGASDGNNLFADLGSCHISSIVERNTADNAESPWVHIRDVGSNYVRVQIKRSNQGGILLGGVYYGNLNNDLAVTVRLNVIGEAA